MKIIKWYPHFALCLNDKGFRECFSRFDLGMTEETPRERKINKRNTRKMEDQYGRKVKI